MNRAFPALLLAVSLASASQNASADVIFGVTASSPNDRIVLGNDGAPETIVDVSQRPDYGSATTIWAVAADFDDRDVYWSQNIGTGATGVTALYRRDWTTGGITSRTVGPFTPQVYGLAYHQTNDQLYFSQGANIFRLDENLNTVGQVFSAGDDIVGLAFDEVNDFLFFTDDGTNTINRLNLSGPSSLTQLATSARPRGVAFDPIGNDVYWIDRDSDDIFRISADGSDNGAAELFLDIPFGSTNHSLAIDGGRLYWAEGAASSRGLWSLNLDGTGLTQSYSTDGGVFGVASIAAVPEPSSFLALALGAVGLGYRRLRRSEPAAG